jgi:hypothetical protein
MPQADVGHENRTLVKEKELIVNVVRNNNHSFFPFPFGRRLVGVFT